MLIRSGLIFVVAAFVVCAQDRVAGVAAAAAPSAAPIGGGAGVERTRDHGADVLIKALTV